MALMDDSMFLFEIIVEKLNNFINCKEFGIKSQFADVFNIHLKDPNERVRYKPGKVKTKRKSKIRKGKYGDKYSTTAKVQTGQSILFANNVEYLISNMKKYPMELSLWSKLVPDYKIGSTTIPWSSSFYEYLNKVHKKRDIQPVCVVGEYNVFDEYTSKKMAVIKLNVKLSYLKDKVTTQLSSVLQENQESNINTGSCPKPTNRVSAIKDKSTHLTEEAGTIKTFYTGKRKLKGIGRNQHKKSKKEKNKAIEVPSNKELTTEYEDTDIDKPIFANRLNNSIVTLVRSYTNLDKNKHAAVIKYQSCSSLDQANLNMFSYIFGGKPAGPFGNQVYCVSYFTVENNKTNSPKSVDSGKTVSDKSQKSEDQSEQLKESYKFKICASECLIKKRDILTCAKSVCSLDLPNKASHLINMKKCDRLLCDYRQMRPMRTPRESHILIDLSKRDKECCDGVEGKVEEILGGIRTKMKFNDDPCYCECECQFGFLKKTTFCNICGGYEKFGDEYTKTPLSELPFPCPIFHKLVDKNKLKLAMSGSDSKREKKREDAGESRKDKRDVIELRKDKKAVGDSKVDKKSDPNRDRRETSEPKRDKKGPTRDQKGGKETKRDKKEISDSKKDKKDATGGSPMKDGKEDKKGSKQKSGGGEKTSASDKETTKTKRRKKKKIYNPFKFNYGYTAPHIGHSRCVLACDDTLTDTAIQYYNSHHRDNAHGKSDQRKSARGAQGKQYTKTFYGGQYQGARDFGGIYPGVNFPGGHFPGRNFPGGSHPRSDGGSNLDDGPVYPDYLDYYGNYMLARRMLPKSLVPKNQGWLWNAKILGIKKPRPQWRPGATSKHIVRLLKIAKNPAEALAKKRKKKDTGKVKKPLKRPLLIVHKIDGEYTITMETMKTYTKPRTFNQHPYEDKPLVTYTIGRTLEENLERKKKKERAHRRLERLQRDFIQSAFKDMCQEICLKSYQQALGILPDAEQPDCSCFPAEPGPDKVDLDYSCSCSEDRELTGSDTDSDEWLLEFTPPNATFDPTYKSKKVTTMDNSSQYTYLDYRVRLVDRYGNPVPRYFTGPDGKQQCSDLGGFYDPKGKWLEINTDGFIGPDGKWAPNTFLGPTGEMIDGETGKFQAADGKWLVIGVDGYIDQGNWKFYPAQEPEPTQKPRSASRKIFQDKKYKPGMKASEATWSCLGGASPKQLSKLGIVGHGQDKKRLLLTLKDLMAKGEDVKIPEPKLVPRSNRPITKGKSSLMRSFIERRKCKHATPSDKGIVAVDGYGNKTYFKLKKFGNKRPKHRIAALKSQGISLSSFHVPCFHSFISSEIMKKQQYDRLVALAKRAGKGNRGKASGGGEETPKDPKTNTTSTQADYVYVV